MRDYLLYVDGNLVPGRRRHDAGNEPFDRRGLRPRRRR